MNKKVMIYFIGLVWIAVLLQLLVMVGTKDDERIVQAFQAMDTIPSKSIVTISGKYGSYLVRSQDQEKLCGHIARELGVTRYQTTMRQDKDNQVVSLCSSNKNAALEIYLQDEGTAQVVTTSVTLTDKINSVIAVKEQLERIYKNMNMDGEVNFSMEGSIPGQMGRSQMHSMRQQIFKILETKMMKTQKTSGATIYYGYSQRLSDSRKIDKKKINVQLIFSYDEEKKMTNLYLAVPFYNQDF